ncbi:hypothetical protein SAMN05421788_102509 [Filimonas lacunae]|uniref:Uncharacterized protein n=1 Tax=Filimonas lacunae TaxID=477680 RepID=A0A173MHA2_9BACT|nr:hypothetical protein [Filimonas lacunae]BAV06857.1 hypothetical protein FLA_2877 [Filimonas lacunae]SIS98763.1 hypothetical protein SAMN05421788_102509 [Filimonas lacunae]
MNCNLHHTKPLAAAIIEGWLSTLEKVRNENVLLKGLLAKALQNEVHAAFIEIAEHYQQLCINQDQLIALLRHDIASLWEQMKAVEGDDDFYKWLTSFRTLEKDMGKLKREFDKMAREFNNSLAAYL